MDDAPRSREDPLEVSSKEAPCGTQSAVSDSGDCGYHTEPEGDEIQASALDCKNVRRHLTAAKALKAVKYCAVRPEEVILNASLLQAICKRFCAQLLPRRIMGCMQANLELTLSTSDIPTPASHP